MQEPRIPPQAIEVEKHVLGGLWLGDDSAHSALDLLTPEDFYDSRNAVLFAATKAVHASGRSVDLVTVSEQLRAQNAVDKAGGDSYLIEISAEVVSAAGIESYAAILKEKAARRQLILDASRIHEAAWDTQVSLEDVRGLAEAKLLDGKETGQKGPVSAKDALVSTLDLIEKVHKGEMQGLQTQYYAFNEASGGFCAPDWNVLAGRPATGKTALALDIADYLATDCGKSVLFCSLEMGKEQLMQRIICRRQGIDFKAMRTGKLGRKEFDRVSQAVQELLTSKLYIDDSPDMTPARVLSLARRHKAKYGLDLVIVDNLSIMEGDGRFENRLQEVTSMTRAFKKNAKRLSCPIMTLVHLSRSIETRGEDAIPRMGDLRECGTIEQDADNVYCLHKPDPMGTRVDVHALKQRNGESPIVIPLTAEFQYMRFKSFEPAGAYVGAR